MIPDYVLRGLPERGMSRIMAGNEYCSARVIRLEADWVYSPDWLLVSGVLKECYKILTLSQVTIAVDDVILRTGVFPPCEPVLMIIRALTSERHKG
jgi:hypothetical protein